MRIKEYVILSLCLIFKYCLASEFQVYEPITVKANVTKYESPIHMSYDNLVDLNGNSMPFWLETYLKSNDLLGQDYSDWISLYHKDYSAGLMDLSEEKFKSLGQRFGKNFGYEKSSIIYEVIFNVGEVSYAYVLFQHGEFYASFQDAVDAGKVSSSAFVLEEGKWQLYRISSGPMWFRKIAMQSYELIEQLIDEGNLIFSSPDSIPSYISELEPFEFFVPQK